MKAIASYRYGGPDTIELAELPEPAAGDDEVLIQVRAAGVGREVSNLMVGLPYLIRLAGFGLRAPKQPILGRDVAGIVAAVGSAVTHVAPGDEVYGAAKGSFADYAVAANDLIAHKPASLTFEEAAAMPVSGCTALGAVDRGQITAGQRVAITGAGGGVGSFAVQIARHRGAEVTAVCSAAKAELVRSLGAADVVDYSTDDFTRTGDRYDVIIDIAGWRRLRDLRRALTPEGRLVIVGGDSGGKLTAGHHRQLLALLLSPLVSQKLTGIISMERRHILDELSGLVDNGAVRPVIDRTWPLGDAAEAIRHLVSNQTCGKSVLVI